MAEAAPMQHDVTGSQLAGVAVPPKMYPQQSHVAATTVVDPAAQTNRRPVTQEEKKKFLGMDADTREFVSDYAVDFALTGVPVPGIQGITAVAAAPFGFMVADHRAQREIKKLSEQVQDQLAEYFHIDPSEITPEHFVMAAHLRAQQGDSTLSSMLETIETEKSVFPFANFAGVGGVFAGGAIGTALAAGALASVPFGGFLIPVAAAGLGFEGMRSLTAGFMGASASGNDSRKIMEDIRAAKDAGEAIEPLDVFKLRMAQNQVAASAVKQMTDRDFYQLKESEQMGLMNHPQFALITQQCFRDAQLVNQPEANVNDLLFGAMRDAQQTHWQNRVGTSKAEAAANLNGRAATQAEKVEAARALAAAQDNSLSA
jgi:hypothetical protein